MTVSFQQPPPPQSQPQPQPDGDQVQGPQPGLERAARVRRLRPGQHGLCETALSCLISTANSASLFPPLSSLPSAHSLTTRAKSVLWLMGQGWHSTKSHELTFFKSFSYLLRFLEIQVALPEHVQHQQLAFIWLGRWAFRLMMQN
ncbi:hypothetical protein ACLB2K_026685 [Fragaria x ananassa]